MSELKAGQIILTDNEGKLLTSDDPKNVLKYDKGKVRMDLIPEELLIEVAKVLEFGANKYSPNGWRQGMDWSRVYAALMRHITAWNAGEDLDPETGLSHMAHAGCCVAFLLNYQSLGVGTDDRYKTRGV